MPLPGEPRESRLQGGWSGVWAAEVALTGALWLGDVPQPRRTCGWPAAAQQRSILEVYHGCPPVGDSPSMLKVVLLPRKGGQNLRQRIHLPKSYLSR